jgi:hypothetical protein
MTDNEYVRNAKTNFISKRKQGDTNTNSIDVPSSQGLPNLIPQEGKYFIKIILNNF